MPNVIDLDKVAAAKEKLAANPAALVAANAQLVSAVDALGLNLSDQERQCLILQLVMASAGRFLDANGICA